MSGDPQDHDDYREEQDYLNRLRIQAAIAIAAARAHEEQTWIYNAGVACDGADAIVAEIVTRGWTKTGGQP